MSSTHTNERARSFRGYRLPDAALARLRAAADRIIEQTATRDPDLVLVAHLPHRPGINGLDGGEEIFKVLIEPTLLDLVEQIIGPDIILWGSSVSRNHPVSARRFSGTKRATIGRCVH